MTNKTVFKIIFQLCVVAGIIFSNSCRKDFDLTPSFGELKFSKDTVFLDTIFSNISSSTYTLKVYNRSNENIRIPTISLENGTNSHYRLNVDGIPGKSFQNIDVLAKDSIYVFIEATIDINTVSSPLYTDKIKFDNGTSEQHVDLVTLTQDAIFIYPGKDPLTMKIDSLSLDGSPTTLKGRFLKDTELRFTEDKPYVIYGYAAVPANKTLIVDAGAKVHFHNNSGLIVDEDAALITNGTLTKKVVFEGDRLEHKFSDVPGQWGTIWIRPESKNNYINNTIIKNGMVGLLIDGSALINNTEIYNNSNFGILARNARVTGFNLVIGSAGEASLACIGGGTYNFSYGTFANYWENGIRSLPSVLINNFVTSIDQNQNEVIEAKDLIQATFNDCIIDGNNNIEFVADQIDGGLFNLKISNSMIKFNDTENNFKDVVELDFNNSQYYKNITLNGFPHFREPFNEDFIIGQDSDAIGKGTPLFIQVYDILGKARNFSKPDIGAYQHVSFQ